MFANRIIIALVVVGVLLGLGFYFYPVDRPQLPKQHKITVTWDKVPRAASYNIYRRPYRSEAYSRLASSATNSYEDSRVIPAETYCYQITSLDSNGRESARSKDLCVAVPRP